MIESIDERISKTTDDKELLRLYMERSKILEIKLWQEIGSKYVRKNKDTQGRPENNK